MDKKRLVIIIIITLALCGNVYFGMMYIFQRMETSRVQQQFRVQQTNERALAFTKLFVEKVLGGTGEVIFEDRLRLENSVREISDKDVFSQWQKFVESGNDADAQHNTALLLSMLLNRIRK